MSELKKIVENTNLVPKGFHCSVCNEKININDNIFTHICPDGSCNCTVNHKYNIEKINIKTNILFKLSGYHYYISYYNMITSLKNIIDKNQDITFKACTYKGTKYRRNENYRHITTGKIYKYKPKQNIHEYEFVCRISITIMK